MGSITTVGSLCTGHGCHPPRKAIEGSSDVMVNGKGVHCVGHRWATHTCDKDTHDGVLAKGSSSVFINGKPAGKIGDPISCGSVVAEASPDVFAG